MSTSVTARACANIALVKYWGKRDSALNLPAAGSLSLTLDALVTVTTVAFDSSLRKDCFELDGKESSTARLSPWLDLVRERAGIRDHAAVVSNNHFPTASGLASSASAFAALALAASKAAGLELSERELSELARRGSGSAARSIFAGFAEMSAGQMSDGSDAVAHQIDEAKDWPLRMVIGIVGGGVKKAVSSRDAMEHCAATSPLYRAWVDSVPADLASARQAIADRDLDALGEVTINSAMAMHASAMASRPPIRYWRPGTLACLDRLEEMRRDGLPAFPTMDAGPHVKVLTDRARAEEIKGALAELPDVSQVIVAAPGPAVRIVDTSGSR